jgi:hypothetical protein
MVGLGLPVFATRSTAYFISLFLLFGDKKHRIRVFMALLDNRILGDSCMWSSLKSNKGSRRSDSPTPRWIASARLCYFWKSCSPPTTIYHCRCRHLVLVASHPLAVTPLDTRMGEPPVPVGVDTRPSASAAQDQWKRVRGGGGISSGAHVVIGVVHGTSVLWLRSFFPSK